MLFPFKARAEGGAGHAMQGAGGEGSTYNMTHLTYYGGSPRSTLSEACGLCQSAAAAGGVLCSTINREMKKGNPKTFLYSLVLIIVIVWLVMHYAIVYLSIAPPEVKKSFGELLQNVAVRR